ncbi:crossover junction endodeoxyribonuclease RuvC [Candidatus Saccharibacteria bacterium]|nr:crossover junction endodeoxyribonuclease RuvC [Candidatus Saccharibacteria bacterium]
MRIIGIDPGTATTGFGVIEAVGGNYKFIDAGVITTKPDISMPERLSQIYTDLTQLVNEVKPEAAAIELLFFGNNVTTAITVGQARGVALLVLHNYGLPIAEYNPMQIKVAITGYGAAKKPQIQEMVKMLLKLPQIPKPDDAADALAIAITHANSFGRNNEH